MVTMASASRWAGTKVRTAASPTGGCDANRAHALREAIHRPARVLGEEQGDREQGTHAGADLDIHSEERVETEPRSRNVADVECEPSQGDEHGEKMAQAREHLVGNGLGGRPRCHENTPDVELRREIHEHRHEDGEPEARGELVGEDDGLREKARPDGRRSHQECRAEKNTDARAGCLVGGHEPAVRLITMDWIR